ncbi:ROK family protein [Martelella soudanensis]|uniref:ROK family protein n=1 Tax=Martelella sp. NC18 TaxID=2740297 RepID=UPI001FEE5815|nr:ROK family protein [Martelella sp. NC18]
MVERVVSDIGELLAASEAPVIGIGQSVPAIVRDDGSLFEIVPSQAGLPLMEIASAIRTTFGLPHFWENAAYCAAGYEAHKPDGNRRCVFHLTLDYGVGGGLVMDGRIFRGAYNQAANIGALIPETGPRPNLTDLARHLAVPVERLDERFIANLHAGGDPALLEWIGDRGHRLSEPLSSVVQLFNPDTIVIGGFLPRSVLEALLGAVTLDAHDIANRRPVLKPALCVSELLGPQGFAQAAALLPIGAQLMGLRVSAPPAASK